MGCVIRSDAICFYSFEFVQLIWIYFAAFCSPTTSNFIVLCLCKRFSHPGCLFHCTPGLRLRAGIYKRYCLKGRSRCLNIGDFFFVTFLEPKRSPGQSKSKKRTRRIWQHPAIYLDRTSLVSLVNKGFIMAICWT